MSKSDYIFCTSGKSNNKESVFCFHQQILYSNVLLILKPFQIKSNQVKNVCSDINRKTERDKLESFFLAWNGNSRIKLVTKLNFNMEERDWIINRSYKRIRWRERYFRLSFMTCVYVIRKTITFDFRSIIPIKSLSTVIWAERMHYVLLTRYE